MSFATLKAEADAIGLKIQAIVSKLRTATIEEIKVVEAHLGITAPVAPESQTFAGLDNRLGVIVNALHTTEEATLDTIHATLPVPSPNEATQNSI